MICFGPHLSLFSQQSKIPINAIFRSIKHSKKHSIGLKSINTIGDYRIQRKVQHQIIQNKRHCTKGISANTSITLDLLLNVIEMKKITQKSAITSCHKSAIGHVPHVENYWILPHTRYKYLYISMGKHYPLPQLCMYVYVCTYIHT